MEKIKITEIGTDSGNRKVFESETGELYKDLDVLGRKLDLCTVIYNEFDGEPDTPLRYIERLEDTWFFITFLDGSTKLMKNGDRK